LEHAGSDDEGNILRFMQELGNFAFSDDDEAKL